MGIPSYYRKLLRSCPGLVRPVRPDSGVDWFFMDFNCLIYHCLRRPGTPPYRGKEDEEAWEGEFIACILDYTQHVVRQVEPRKGVCLAVDGVVPMAKMRQQRLRRFKSSWMKREAKAGAGVGAETGTDSWNTNAITPGTRFMDRLMEALSGLCEKANADGKATADGKAGRKKTQKTGVRWTLRSCREPGEGEHKILAEWRKGGLDGVVAVYGLDADLIVLSLLGYETCDLSSPVWLFREEMEKGSVARDAMGNETYEWFSVGELRQWLVQVGRQGKAGTEEKDEKAGGTGGVADPEKADRTGGVGGGLRLPFILHYVCAMSVLGNDFLPTSLSYPIRDEGHSELLHTLHRLLSQGVTFIHPATLEISWEGLRLLFRALSETEAQRIHDGISKKRAMARWTDVATVGEENWPLFHIEEAVLLQERHGLRPEWQALYTTHFFPGFPNHSSTVDRICHDYLYGIQWIWAYYLGRTEEVCFDWYYPFSLPPLWEWLGRSSASGLPAFPGTIRLKAEEIQPVEQLALVLPLESWSLLPPCPQRSLPYRAPHLFPDVFGFESLGKRFFWECESLIPIPTMSEVKAYLVK